MNNYSINEVLEMAIQTERLGQLFYAKLAHKFVKKAEMSALFTTLAAKEKEHEKIFTGIRDSAARQGEEPVQWDEVSGYMRAFVESEFFLGNRKALPALTRVKTVKDAVGYALGFEKETLLYFLGLRSVVKEKNKVDEVIAEEKRHIVWLQKVREGLKKRS